MKRFRWSKVRILSRVYLISNKEFTTLPDKEKDKTLKDICKLNLDVFKNDLLALLKITCKTFSPPEKITISS